jgi:hypothetical protein
VQLRLFNHQPLLSADTKGAGYYAALTPGISYWPVRAFKISLLWEASISAVSNYNYPTDSGSTPTNYDRYANDFGARFGLN